VYLYGAHVTSWTVDSKVPHQCVSAPRLLMLYTAGALEVSLSAFVCCLQDRSLYRQHINESTEPRLPHRRS
jgi:hypothetical protein